MTCNIIEYAKCSEPSNLTQAVLSRLAHTYIDKPNMVAFTESLVKPLEEIEAQLCGFENAFNIDEAVGDQLDLIGQIVGFPRVVCNVYRELFFGFKTTGNDDEDCCEGELTVGLCDGPFFCEGQSLRFRDYHITDDNEYRFLMNAWIFSQGFDGSVEQVDRLVAYLFDGAALEDPAGNTTARVLTHNAGVVTIGVDRDLTMDETRKAELYKFVLPYHGLLQYKIMYGDSGFFILGTDSDRGLCTNFAKVI